VRSSRIGTSRTHDDTHIAGISGVTVAEGIRAVIDSNGNLGTVTFSVRYKDEIKPMDEASETVLSLKPVSFCYKHDLDPESIPHLRGGSS